MPQSSSTLENACSISAMRSWSVRESRFTEDPFGERLIVAAACVFSARLSAASRRSFVIAYTPMAAKTRSVDRDPVHRAGRRVRALRGARGLALRDLADRGGVAVTFNDDLPLHFEKTASTETAFTAVVTAGLRNT